MDVPLRDRPLCPWVGRVSFHLWECRMDGQRGTGPCRMDEWADCVFNLGVRA
jgi:hypothetical protein